MRHWFLKVEWHVCVCVQYQSLRNNYALQQSSSRRLLCALRCVTPPRTCPPASPWCSRTCTSGSAHRCHTARTPSPCTCGTCRGRRCRAAPGRHICRQGTCTTHFPWSCTSSTSSAWQRHTLRRAGRRTCKKEAQQPAALNAGRKPTAAANGHPSTGTDLCNLDTSTREASRQPLTSLAARQQAHSPRSPISSGGRCTRCSRAGTAGTGPSWRPCTHRCLPPHFQSRCMRRRHRTWWGSSMRRRTAPGTAARQGCRQAMAASRLREP